MASLPFRFRISCPPLRYPMRRKVRKFRLLFPAGVEYNREKKGGGGNGRYRIRLPGQLGLAVGDAMGYAVDAKNLEEIHRDYGPSGLLGYDLVNGYADVTSYTQLAAFTANGLLIASTRGAAPGVMAPFVRYIAMAQQEWSKIQVLRRLPEATSCWISHVEHLRRRVCMDTRMLDVLNNGPLGTVEDTVNDSTESSALSAAVSVWACFSIRTG